MKTIRLTILMSITLFFTSCKDDSVRPVDLTGDWQSEEIYVNGKLQKDISKTTWLLLKKDNIYKNNYITGTWSLNERNLELTPNENLSLQPLQYEVTKLSNASLTLEITLTEREYNWDFEDIEADELITVTEKYSKK
ncbi:hypothetical protein DXT99_07310 [Pontibacter diazotrophicus]|uniref:Lipocalin-like domain-containing protein n=1 Tax=Pontibacter diazotrophicus TaxID=1400979 RepID=A0A3D8LER8_9BACT|nr:hypothetical protein [Pontibacter diazotrophicus]RDV15806.1 hypothetical protein DXT99_07310 [Pontibacter diazotrophicus]